MIDEGMAVGAMVVGGVVAVGMVVAGTVVSGTVVWGMVAGAMGMRGVVVRGMIVAGTVVSDTVVRGMVVAGTVVSGTVVRGMVAGVWAIGGMVRGGMVTRGVVVGGMVAGTVGAVVWGVVAVTGWSDMSGTCQGRDSMESDSSSLSPCGWLGVPCGSPTCTVPGIVATLTITPVSSLIDISLMNISEEPGFFPFIAIVASKMSLSPFRTLLFMSAAEMVRTLDGHLPLLFRLAQGGNCTPANWPTEESLISTDIS